VSSRVERANAKPFLRQTPTLNALQKLNDYDEIVIYCGAGVTIDQTGVSWTQLVRHIFRAGRTVVNDATRAKSVEFLIDQIQDPRQLASIVVEAFKPSMISEQEFLGSQLHSILYSEDTWSVGLILRNLAYYAVMAALFSHSVTIITTNYDSFIEKKLDDRARQVSSEAGDIAVPAKRTTLSTETGPDTEILRADESATGSIEVIYLHGRVAQDGKVQGDLVLTEGSYAKTRQQSRDILTKHFGRSDAGQAKALLIVGASLTDEPLIDALYHTREDAPPAGQEPQYRVALTAAPLSEGWIDARFSTEDEATRIKDTDVLKTLALRGQHLGLEILWPAFHTQTAQFLEELRVDLDHRTRSDGKSSYRDAEEKVSYEHRLKSWSTAFATGRALTDQDFTHETLALLKTSVEERLDALGADRSGEILRTELWARVTPSSHMLELIGSSSGPIRDVDTFRKEPIDSTANASVVAFREGRPLFRSLDDLNLSDKASRWKTFFAVPVFLHVESVTGGGGLIPVGVVTLTSSHGYKSEGPGKRSALEELAPNALHDMANVFIGVGRTMLSPEWSKDAGAASD